MVEEKGIQAPGSEPRKRKNRFKKPPNNAKKMKVIPGMGKKPKVSKKMKKLYSKRAKEYNSDSDDGKESEPERMDEEEENEERDDKAVENDGEEEDDRGENSDEEDNVPLLKLSAGSNAFRNAFQNIMNLPAEDESVGPILSAHKRHAVAKLAAEETKKKFYKERKKEKISIDERGHVKLKNILDTHDKVLIGIATKGVVKFFNAVNKAQTAQKGLDPSRFKDAKALTKRRKEAFMSELKKASGQSAETASKSTGKEDSNQPAWAPLRDSFMLTNSKLKDWDKMEEDKEVEI